MLVRPCGCSTLDGQPYHQCENHKAEGGKLAPPAPELEAWLKKHKQGDRK